MSNVLIVTKKYDVKCDECGHISVVKEHDLNDKCPKCGSYMICIEER